MSIADNTWLSPSVVEFSLAKEPFGEGGFREAFNATSRRERHLTASRVFPDTFFVLYRFLHALHQKRVPSRLLYLLNRKKRSCENHINVHVSEAEVKFLCQK